MVDIEITDFINDGKSFRIKCDHNRHAPMNVTRRRSVPEIYWKFAGSDITPLAAMKA